jgi:hypothetical protein
MRHSIKPFEGEQSAWSRFWHKRQTSLGTTSLVIRQWEAEAHSVSLEEYSVAGSALSSFQWNRNLLALCNLFRGSNIVQKWHNKRWRKPGLRIRGCLSTEAKQSSCIGNLHVVQLVSCVWFGALQYPKQQQALTRLLASDAVVSWAGGIGCGGKLGDTTSATPGTSFGEVSLLSLDGEWSVLPFSFFLSTSASSPEWDSSWSTTVAMFRFRDERFEGWLFDLGRTNMVLLMKLLWPHYFWKRKRLLILGEKLTESTKDTAQSGTWKIST